MQMVDLLFYKINSRQRIRECTDSSLYMNNIKHIILQAVAYAE